MPGLAIARIAATVACWKCNMMLYDRHELDLLLFCWCCCCCCCCYVCCCPPPPPSPPSQPGLSVLQHLKIGCDVAQRHFNAG